VSFIGSGAAATSLRIGAGSSADDSSTRSDDVHLNTAGAIGDLGDQVGAFHAARLNRFGRTGAVSFASTSIVRREVMHLGCPAEDHQRPFDIADQDEEPAAPLLQLLRTDEIPALQTPFPS
jgi:hypothetical protein